MSTITQQNLTADEDHMIYYLKLHNNYKMDLLVVIILSTKCLNKQPMRTESFHQEFIPYWNIFVKV